MEGVMRSRLFLVFAVLFIAAMSALAGCRDDDPVTPKKTGPDPYADLTEPEHVIENLLQSYEDRNYERFCELLKDPEYLFFLQPRDVCHGCEAYLNLEEDCDITRRMFLAAMGTPEGNDPKVDRLELAITDGIWTDIDSIGDEACTDCQQTERIYDITLVIGETTYLGNDIISLIVQPVEEQGKMIYKIRRAYDLPKY
jgi:hypothetical protein